jgi:CRP-like cAMP-binding protein
MYANLIKAIERFIRLDNTETALLEKLFTVKQFSKGDFFLKEGQVCKDVGFIEKGIVRYFINHEGEELNYGFGQDNNFVCNYESFLDHSPSSKNIQFIEPATLLSISYDNLQVMYEGLREGQRFGRLVCEQIFVESLRQITSFYTDQPEQRYIHFIRSYPDLQQRIPQYHISSYVGVKPQSLSRIRKRLADSGKS